MRTKVQFYDAETGKAKGGGEILKSGARSLTDYSPLGMILIVNVNEWGKELVFTAIVASGLLHLYRERGKEKQIITSVFKQSAGVNQRYMPVLYSEVGFVSTGEGDSRIVVAKIENIYTRKEKQLIMARKEKLQASLHGDPK